MLVEVTVEIDDALLSEVRALGGNVPSILKGALRYWVDDKQRRLAIRMARSAAAKKGVAIRRERRAMRSLLLGTVAALSLGAVHGRAASIVTFGSFVNTPGCVASTRAGDQGLICADDRLFTVGGTTFAAFGFSNGFTGASALTLKLDTTNALDESGLGENAANLTDCSDAVTCEIKGRAAVAVISNGEPIDAVVGSVQTGENFKLFTGDSLLTLTEVASGVGGSCPVGPVADTCHFDFAPSRVVGLESGGVGDVLLTELSFAPAAVPEASSLAVLGVGLVGLGVVYRRRRRAS